MGERKVMKVNKIFSAVLGKLGIIYFVLKLCYIPIGILIAQILAKVVSNAIKGKTSQVIQNAVNLLIILVSFHVCYLILEIWLEKKKLSASHKCKMMLYKGYLERPLWELSNITQGDAIEKLNDDFDTVKGKYLSLFPEFWTGIITAVIYFFYLQNYNLGIAIILLVIAILQLVPPIVVKKYLQVNYEKTREIEAQITDYVIAAYKGFTTIKLYDLKEWYLKKLSKLHKKYIKTGNEGELAGSIENSMDTLMEYILKYGTYAFVGLFIVWGILNLEIGVQVIALAGSFFSSVKTVFGSIPQFSISKIAEKRIALWFEERNEKQHLIEDPNIELKHIFYNYEEKEIFYDVSFIMSCDKKILIKGENGIGKSTLFQLILGEKIPIQGEIKIGGLNPELIQEEDLEKKIFLLLQDDIVFTVSPDELFSMIGREKKEKCMQYARKFGLSEETIKEKRISELSGGQKKQVYLSIAFASETYLLLLDEPTNYLDEKTKQIFYQLLKERAGGVIIISHDMFIEELVEEVYEIKDKNIKRIK